MSENEAIFFKLDMQPAIAALISANDGRCGGDEGAWVSCDGEGEGSCFPGTPCPLEGMLFRGIIPCPCWGKEQRAVAAKDWLDKYHQRKAKAAKKQEQKSKPEPVVLNSGDALHVSATTVNGKATGFSQSVERGEGEGKSEPKKTCGACRHVWPAIIDLDAQQIVVCKKKRGGVPVLYEGCLDFEPKVSEKSAFERLSAAVESGAEAAEASSKIAAEYLSGVDSSTRLAGDKDATERIAQLEKENDKLQCSLRGYKGLLESAHEICNGGQCDLKKENAELQKTNAHLRDELAWKFEQLTNKIEMLQDQNDRLRKQIDAAIEEKNSAIRRFAEQVKQILAENQKNLEREANKRNWPPRIKFFL